MTIQTEALKLALEALEKHGDAYLGHSDEYQFAITKVKEALMSQSDGAQPAVAEQHKQEPCGWQFYQDGKWHNGMEIHNHRANTEAAGVPVRDVYPAPQRKPWVGLTKPEIDDIYEAVKQQGWAINYARAIEAKLKAKNERKEKNTHIKPLTDEPTKEMIDAAERIDWSDSDVRGNIVNMWQAMAAVAPQPSKPLPLTDEQRCLMSDKYGSNLHGPDSSAYWYFKGIDDTEAAHGIVGDIHE